MSITLLGFDSIDPAVSTSLKEVDPTDYLGDGSNLTIPDGTKAIVFGYDSKIIFYSLEFEMGHSDDGIEEVIPENNPSNYYWKCRGFTKDTFTGASTGERFEVPNGSRIAPVGFTFGVLPYFESNVLSLGVENDGSDWSWQGFGIVNGVTYTVASDYLVTNILGRSTYNYNARPDGTTAGVNFGWHPAHCVEGNDGSEFLITDAGNYSTDVALSIYDIRKDEYRTLAYVFPNAETTLDDIFIGAGSGLGMRHKNWHYCITANVSTNKFVRINVLTGDVEILANVPYTTTSAGSFLCPRFSDNTLFFLGADDADAICKYDIALDSWDTLATCSSGGNLWGWDLAFIDEITESLILVVPGLGSMVYDVVLNSWELDTTIPWDANTLYSSYAFYYKDRGTIWPHGFESLDIANTYKHAIIPKNNPAYIVKD